MTEQTKTPEEFIKEVRLKRNIYHDNFPDFIIAQMLRDYKNQFSSPQDEEIEIQSEKAYRDEDYGILEQTIKRSRREGFVEGAKWMREKLNK